MFIELYSTITRSDPTITVVYKFVNCPNDNPTWLFLIDSTVKVPSRVIARIQTSRSQPHNSPGYVFEFCPMKRLNNIPWATEFKSSRYPKNVTRSVGSWKAEEVLIFAYPIAEVVFEGLLTDGQREEWMCLARMIEFIKNHARNGWTKESSDTFHAMCLRYAVLLEERQGTQKCVIILHNLLRFSLIWSTNIGSGPLIVGTDI